MATIFDRLLEATRDYLGTFGEPVRSFVAALEPDLRRRPLEIATLPVCRHLRRCVDGASPRGRPLMEALARHAARLHWGQTYAAADFGETFLQNYGWVELFGTRGHFATETMAGGFLMLGPDIVYPDHHHLAEEIYLPLTGGTEWRMGDGAFTRRAADETIHHPSDVSHAMRTGREALLALYLWRGGPLAQKSKVGPSTG